jgi:hypothetical protein
MLFEQLRFIQMLNNDDNMLEVFDVDWQLVFY